MPYNTNAHNTTANNNRPLNFDRPLFYKNTKTGESKRASLVNGVFNDPDGKWVQRYNRAFVVEIKGENLIRLTDDYGNVTSINDYAKPKDGFKLVNAPETRTVTTYVYHDNDTGRTKVSDVRLVGSQYSLVNTHTTSYEA